MKTEVLITGLVMSLILISGCALEKSIQEESIPFCEGKKDGTRCTVQDPALVGGDYNGPVYLGECLSEVCVD